MRRTRGGQEEDKRRERRQSRQPPPPPPLKWGLFTRGPLDGVAGDGMDPASKIGPMVSALQRDQVAAQVLVAWPRLAWPGLAWPRCPLSYIFAIRTSADAACARRPGGPALLN